ncbi:MAG TPA: sugar phosphate isomerase/epimerase [Planctomycetota bacterium]|nr:sugar phosphate isomerase/epimerase [Planctomycetota bacterium]
MIVGYHTGGMDVDLAQAATALREAGYDGMQIAGPVLARIVASDGWDRVPEVLAAERIQPICVNLGAPDLGDWLAIAAGAAPASLARLRAALADAARAAMPCAMVCIWGPEHPPADALRRAGRAFAAFARDAHERFGTRLTVHQHAGCPLQDADEVAAFAETFDGVSTALTADTAHLALCGVDPADFMRRFAPLIDLVHIKDLRARRFLYPGEGDIDFAAVFAALVGIAFDRALVADIYEARLPPDPVRASRAWLGAQLAVALG